MADLKQRFGKNVAEHRKRLGLTQDALATSAQLSIDMIKRVETGRVGASFDVVGRLSTALGVSASALFVTDDAASRQVLDQVVLKLSSMSDEQIAWLNDLLEVLNRKP